MKNLDWDYTQLADSYLARPPYAERVLDRAIAYSGARNGCRCCDIGAGTGNLTIPLLGRGLLVDAVEPNAVMRLHGIRRTKEFDERVKWSDARGEATGLPSNIYSLVTFGSSFNVVDRHLALKETARLLQPGGWFLCLWNHRDLSDPIQAEIEAAIRNRISEYSYGNRRQDQTHIIIECGLFEDPISLEAPFSYTLDTEDWIEAWRSHATLARQAGDAFECVIEEITHIVRRVSDCKISVPYTTRGWICRVKDVCE